MTFDVSAGRPNFFVGIRLHGIQSQIEEFNSLLVSANFDLKPFFTSTKKLHITNLVMELKSTEDIDTARCCLRECQPYLEDIFRDTCEPKLEFKEIGAFPGRVLYLEPTEDIILSKLRDFSAHLHSRYAAAGLISSDSSISGSSNQWVPHLTLAKSSQSRFRKPKPSTFSLKSYSHLADSLKPIMAPLTVVELLSMAESSTAESDAMGVQGYYKAVETLYIR